MKRELILLIPGLARMSRCRQLTHFVEGMIAASQSMPLAEIADESVPSGFKRLKGVRNGEPVEFDVKEAYWNDMVPSLSQESIGVRVQRGLSLFFYWAFSATWRRFLNRKYLTFGLCLSMVAFFAWYASTLLLFVDVVLTDKNTLIHDFLAPATIDQAKSVVDASKTAVEGGGVQWSSFVWQFWMVMTLITTAIPVSLLVDISDFAKRYMSNESAEPGRPAIRLEIVAQIREQLHEAVNREKYHRVTVVGHSFGSTVAVDLLADLPLLEPPLRLITMGSLIEFLASRSEWFKDDVNRLVARQDIEQWIDINSRDDWFASGVGEKSTGRFQALEVKSFGTFLDKAAARVHSRYFDNQQAVRVLLNSGDSALDATPAFGQKQAWQADK